MRRVFIAILSVVVLASCYNDNSRTMEDAAAYGRQQDDSVFVLSGRHYTFSDNFVVRKDSLMLLMQLPEELLNGMVTDTFPVLKGEIIAVADVRVIPDDLQDSVWVQVARDQESFGWVHESEMLGAVVPDDPISQFISTFSDIHLLIFLVVISAIGMVYLVRRVLRRKAKIVHFNDIASFYPALLALLVASSATLYSSIQLFASDMWQHFYFHPTLNPFSQPVVLALFLVSVWAILIVGLACVDVVFGCLPFGDAALYLCGLAGVCAVNYIVFSVSTLYYIGYLLLVAYYVYAIRRHLRHSFTAYVCGSCGSQLRHKGKCPACGVYNE